MPREEDAHIHKAAVKRPTSENGWGKPHPYKTKKPRGTLIR
jgi:hypothetical protein